MNLILLILFFGFFQIGNEKPIVFNSMGVVEVEEIRYDLYISDQKVGNIIAEKDGRKGIFVKLRNLDKDLTYFGEYRVKCKDKTFKTRYLQARVDQKIYESDFSGLFTVFKPIKKNTIENEVYKLVCK